MRKKLDRYLEEEFGTEVVESAGVLRQEVVGIFDEQPRTQCDWNIGSKAGYGRNVKNLKL